ncbi:MAG TPA: hypothetical protein PLX73_00925 [Candidatus Paceibacterota bacterium]|nr:hypothetical protein [Candidatus Paceibacterota bacterium]HOL53795.1 hypothetical protein [Candidatus Paceibacterota bacterium]HON21559.1 hypothetical protein [Candidatus Paceibacterota bacterium]HPP16936.1 hypothetical protein [Candidatus Paceibacterota bacterium]HRU33432.1 hypothetical protein [Candidatus Paceibacterota bacterium]
MRQKIRFFKWTPQDKINAVIALGMGFKRDFTDISDQTKSVCSTAALIALQNNVPLILVGQEMASEREESEEIDIQTRWIPNETVKMYRFVRYLHTEETLINNLAQLDAPTLYGKLDRVLDLIEQKEWEKIVIVCHVDMVRRMKKVLKQLSLIKDAACSVYLAPVRPAYNGDCDFWWTRENWRAKLYEGASRFFNLINR